MGPTRRASGRSRVGAAEARVSAAVLAVAATGVAAALLALAERLRDAPPALRLASLAAVPGLPILHHALTRPSGRRAGRRPRPLRSAVLALVLAAAAVALLAPAGPGAVLLAALAMGLVRLGLTPERTGESVLVVLTGVAVALTGLVAHPSGPALALLVAEVGLAAVALVLIHGREVRRGVVHRGRPTAAPPESRAGAALRAVSGLVLGALVVALLPLLIGAEHAAVGFRWGGGVATAPEEELDAEDVKPKAGARASVPGGAGGAALRYPDGLPDGIRDASVPAQSFGDVRVFGGGPGGAPFLLRGNVLGLAAPGGFEQVPLGAAVHATGDVVPAHGVGPLFELAPPPAGPEVTLEIRHTPIEFGGGGLVLLPAATHSVRVVRPLGDGVRVLHQRSHGVFTLPRPAPGLLVFEASVAADRFRDSTGSGAGRASGRIRHDDPRWTALPPGLPAGAAIAAFARRLVGRGRTLDDVRNVAAFLRREFVYDTSVPFEGLGGVERLLNGRRGFCQHFALTAAVLLRAAGLPARIATGYLVNDWDPDARAYEIWSSDRHAWVEVHLEDVGWVPIEVTPSGVLTDLMRRRGEAGGEEAAAPPEDLEPLLAPLTLERVLDRAIGIPLAAVRGIGRRPDLALMVLGAAGLLAVAVLAGGRAVRGRLAAAGPGAPDTRWVRVLTALAAHGLRPAGGQTPRQFAREVVRRRGAPLRDLQRVVELFYRARFGRRPLRPDEERFVDTFTDSIR